MSRIIVLLSLLLISVSSAVSEGWEKGGWIRDFGLLTYDAVGSGTVWIKVGYKNAEVISLNDAKKIAEFDCGFNALAAACHNSAHNLIGLKSNEGQILIYNYETDQIISQTQSTSTSEYKKRLIAVTEYGKFYIEISTDSMTVNKRRISNGEIVDSHKLDIKEYSEINLSPNGEFTTWFNGDTLVVWDNIEKKLCKKMQNLNYIEASYSRLSYTADKFVYLDNSDTIRILDIDSEVEIFEHSAKFTNGWGFGLFYNNYALSPSFDKIGVDSLIYDVETNSVDSYVGLRGNLYWDAETCLVDINLKSGSYSVLVTTTEAPAIFDVIHINQIVDGNTYNSGTIPQYSGGSVGKYSWDGSLLSIYFHNYFAKSENDEEFYYLIFDTESGDELGRCDFRPTFSPDNKSILKLIDGRIEVSDLNGKPTGKIIQPEDMKIDSFVVIDEKLLMLKHKHSYAVYDYINDKILRAFECMQPRLIEKGKKYVCKTDNHVEIFNTFSGELIQEFDIQEFSIPEGYIKICEADDYKLQVYSTTWDLEQRKTIVIDQVSGSLLASYDKSYDKYTGYNSYVKFGPHNKLLYEVTDDIHEKYYQYLFFFNAFTGAKLCGYSDYSYRPTFKFSPNFKCIGSHNSLSFKHTPLCEEAMVIGAISNVYEKDGSTQSAKTFPNPAQDNITIELPENLIGSRLNVTITDILGREVQSLANIVGSFDGLSVDISGLNSGVYMITIVSGSKIVRSRFVVGR